MAGLVVLSGFRVCFLLAEVPFTVWFFCPVRSPERVLARHGERS